LKFFCRIGSRSAKPNFFAEITKLLVNYNKNTSLAFLRFTQLLEYIIT